MEVAGIAGAPLIRQAPRVERLVRSAGRPGVTVDVTINGFAAVVKGATVLHGSAPENSEGQGRPCQYSVPRDDPRQERFLVW